MSFSFLWQCDNIVLTKKHIVINCLNLFFSASGSGMYGWASVMLTLQVNCGGSMERTYCDLALQPLLETRVIKMVRPVYTRVMVNGSTSASTSLKVLLYTTTTHM